MVAVAQLVESRIVIPVVVGSNPIGHPILIKHLTRLTRVFCCPKFSNGALSQKMGQLTTERHKIRRLKRVEFIDSLFFCVLQHIDYVGCRSV